MCFCNNAHSQSDTVGYSKHLQLINSLIDNGNYELASKKNDSLFLIATKLNFKKGIADVYNYRGVINRDQSNLKAALENYLNALEVFTELNLPTKIAGIQNNIGQIYAEIKEYRTALSYYFKAVNVNVVNKNSGDLALNYNNIATCYQKLNQFVSAKSYLNKSLAIHQHDTNIIGMAMANHNLGINLQLTNQKDSALIYFNKSLSYLTGMEENIGHAYNYLEIGNTLLDLNNKKEAERYLIKSLHIAEKNDLEGIKVEVYKNLSDLFSLNDNFKDAYRYQKLYLVAKEKIEGEENKNDILKKELEYEFSKKQELQRKDAESKQLIAQTEIKNQKRFTTYAIIALIMLSGLIVIVLRSYNQKRKANFIISKQKEIVEHKNKEILDSINYAKYIQTAILPSDKTIASLPFKCEVIFKPKDIVSGDFYWLHQTTTHIFLAVVDCTGHGVPGALVSVVGNNGLNRCIEEFKLIDTGKILDKLSELVEETFDKSENEIKDGMDISLLSIALDSLKTNDINIQWSGANNPLWLFKKEAASIEELKANKQPIGKHISKNSFITHQLHLKKGDKLYTFTDGFADQFGGPKGKKFKYKQLNDILLSTKQKPIAEQSSLMQSTFQNWKGDLEQVDDLCVMIIEF